MIAQRLSKVVAMALAGVVLGPVTHASAADSKATLARGKYLVTVVGGCGDCHTPGALMGQPEMNHFLGGADVGFAIPGLGVFVPANLTPDRATGLGAWTRTQIIAAFTAGKRPDGRTLAPIMPWMELSRLTKSDANAIAAYLQSLPPVDHKVAGPFGPSEKATVFVETVVPAEVFNSMPKPPAGPPPGGPPAGK